MFKCAITGKTSKPGEGQNKIVFRKRERVYTQKYFDEETRLIETVEVGRGWEVVEEVNASDEGVQMWNELTPDEQDMFIRSRGQRR
jgi:hypothetical protein